MKIERKKDKKERKKTLNVTRGAVKEAPFPVGDVLMLINGSCHVCVSLNVDQARAAGSDLTSLTFYSYSRRLRRLCLILVRLILNPLPFLSPENATIYHHSHPPRPSCKINTTNGFPSAIRTHHHDETLATKPETKLFVCLFIYGRHVSHF